MKGDVIHADSRYRENRLHAGVHFTQQLVIDVSLRFRCNILIDVYGMSYMKLPE